MRDRTSCGVFRAAIAAGLVALGLGSVRADIPASAYIQDGLIGHWDGIENAGVGQHDNTAPTWVDLAGGIGDATRKSDGVVWLGNCWTNGVDGKPFEVDSDFAQTLATKCFTLEVRVMPTRTSDRETIIGNYSAGQNFNLEHNGASPTGCFRFYCNNAPNWGTPATVQAGETVSASFVAPAGGYPIAYKNGALAGTHTAKITDSMSGSHGTIFGGEYNRTSMAFRGAFYSVRLYNRALTAEEIAINSNIDKMRFAGAVPAELTWPEGYRWNSVKQCVEYRVSVQGTGGATVSLDGETFAASVATEWAELGTPVNVTVTARPPQGCSVVDWEGVPKGVAAVREGNSITLTLTGAATLTPVVHTCATLHWRGGTDALASKAANWVDGEGNAATAAPLTGDAIVIDAQSTNQAMTWDLDEVVPASWTQTGWAGTVTFMTGSVGRKANNVAQTVHGSLCDDGSNVEFRVSGDVTVSSGKWTVTATPSFKSTDAGWIDGLGVYRLLVRVGGDFTVGEEATVDVISRGFLGRQGPGYSTLSVNGQPASHGGGAINMNGGKLMPCYGDLKAPVTVGSAGALGQGGGAIRIFVDGCSRIDGALDASTTPSVQWYASAGGSVYLKTGTLAGSGPIRANGQQATSGGSGGGGRVAIVLTGAEADFSSFTGDVSAYGGYTSEKNMGSPGTIYYEKPADAGKGKLVIRGVSGVVTSPYDLSRGITTGLTGVLGPSTTYEFSEIVVTNGASLGIATNVTVKAAKLTGYNRDTDHVTLHGGKLIIPTGQTIEGLAIGSREVAGGRVEFSGVAEGARGLLIVGDGGQIGSDLALTVDGDLEIGSGGLATHTFNYNKDRDYRLNLTVNGDLTVAEGGLIDVSGKGYMRDASCPWQRSVHAGVGGHGGTRVCYGNVKCPTEIGARGGSYTPYSGGAMHIVVTGQLSNAGIIRANGYDGWASGSSEVGGGGSVWISAKRMTGGGPIRANGQDDRRADGIGGGGRVALYLTGAGETFADYTGKIEAYGGHNKNCTTYYGAGTVYLHTADEDDEGGTLIINGGATNGKICALTEFTTDVTETSYDTVIITNGASVKQYKNTTITVRKDWLNYGTYEAEVGDAENASATVVFTNADVTSHIVGANPFAAVTCVTPGKRFAFGTGANDLFSIVVGGKLLLRGEDADGKRIELGPDTEGEKWRISIADGASMDMEGLYVAGSDASASPTKPTAKNSVDSGDNVDWTFVNIKVGEVITWAGAVSASWNQPGNWQTEEGKARVPVETDMVVIPAGTPNVPTLGEPLTVATLTVATGAALDLATYDLTVTDTLTVNGSMLARKAETIELRGDVSFAANAFACARSTIVLTGADDKTADFGDNVLWDIRFARDGTTTAVTGGFTARRVWAQPAAAAVLAFAKDVSVTSREWWLGGIDGASPLLSLVSATEGEKWNLTAVSHAWVRGVRVRDSNAAGGNAVFAQTPCEDLAGNVNWRLGVVATEWTGESDTAFENPSNWSTGEVPGADDLAVLGEGATVVVPAEGATVGELHVEGATAVSGGRLTTVGSAYVRCGELTLDAPLSVGQDLDVRSEGAVTHTKNGTAEGHRVDISVVRDLYVWPDGQIHANAKGYSAGEGPGHPPGTSAGSSHGGRGSGVCYGSFRHPTESGSGGGSWNGAGKAWGGGVISLDVKGTTTVEGGVTANGERKDWYGPSGGSVYLSTRFLAGNGTISANGGNLVNGGLGGGGRVAVYLTDAGATFDGFAGLIAAYGGRSDATGSGVGGAGTVFKSLASDPEDGGTLVLDNGNVAAWNSNSRGGGTDFPLIDEVDHRQNANLKVVIGQYGHLVSRGPITVKELEMSDSTGKLNLNGQALSILSTVHRSRKKPKDALGHWQGDWPGTVDYSVEGSTIRWGAGFLLFVR